MILPPKLSYPDLPLYSHFFSLGFHKRESHSPPHHPLNTPPPTRGLHSSHSTTRVKFLTCRWNRVFLELVFSMATSYLQNRIPFPSPSLSAYLFDFIFCCLFLYFTESESHECFFPASMHLHIYSSCLKCLPPPTRQLQYNFSAESSFLAGKVLLTLHV